MPGPPRVTRTRPTSPAAAAIMAGLAAAPAARADTVDSAINTAIDLVKATGEAVKAGISAAETGVEYAKTAYDQVGWRRWWVGGRITGKQRSMLRPPATRWGGACGLKEQGRRGMRYDWGWYSACIGRAGLGGGGLGCVTVCVPSAKGWQGGMVLTVAKQLPPLPPLPLSVMPIHPPL